MENIMGKMMFNKSATPTNWITTECIMQINFIKCATFFKLPSSILKIIKILLHVLLNIVITPDTFYMHSAPFFVRKHYWILFNRSLIDIKKIYIHR